MTAAVTVTGDLITIGETMALLVAVEPGSLAQVTHFTKRLAGADTNVAAWFQGWLGQPAWI